MAARTAARQLEFVWRGSASWGPASDVFAHNYPTGARSAPPPAVEGEGGEEAAPPPPAGRSRRAQLIRCSTLPRARAGNYGPPPGFNWDWGSSDAYIVAR